MKRKFVSLLLLLTFAGCLLGCSNKEERKEEYVTFTIMSYNMRYNGDSGNLSASKRMPRIIERILEVDPDIIGGQEAQAIHISGLQKNLADIYDIIYTYRETTPLNIGAESCPILYKKDKFELLDHGTFWLSETPDVESRMEGAGHNRICTWVHLKELTYGRDFYYYNTHLDFGEAQTKSLPILLGRLATDAPVILGGDLNMSPDEENYLTMTSDLSDSRVTVGTDMTVGTFHDYSPPQECLSRHIDYLLYRGDILPLTHNVLTNDEELWGEGNYASDHYPLLATFKLKKNS